MIENAPSLLKSARLWVKKTIDVLNQLGVYRKSPNLPPPKVVIDSSSKAAQVACYRKWTHTISFSWNGTPWKVSFLKIVAAHETWHAVQQQLWGEYHAVAPLVRHW